MEDISFIVEGAEADEIRRLHEFHEALRENLFRSFSIPRDVLESTGSSRAEAEQRQEAK